MLAGAVFVGVARLVLPLLAPAPDIVLVVWDTARADHTTVHGYARNTTPHLARIAAESIVYENAIAPAPWTVPSMASLFTGLFVQHHGVSLDPDSVVLDLPREATTLATALAAAGYDTAAYTEQGIYDEPGFRRGFREFVPTPRAELVARAAEFLARPRSGPAFVLVHWLDPHAPYLPEPAHRGWVARWPRPANLSGAGTREDFTEDERGAGFVFKDDVNEGGVVLTPAQWSQLVDQYDGELQQTDAALGALWGEVERRGRAATTALVVLADHGEGFGEHPRQQVWHDHPYDTILRVPLVLRFPSGLPRGRVRSLVGSLDVYATLLQLGGAALPAGIDSVPLPARDGAGRALVGASHYVGAVSYYRDEQLKLIEYRQPGLGPQLFDLRADPRERQDLAGTRPDLVAEARARMRRALARGAARPFAAPAASESLERLRALGYVN